VGIAGRWAAGGALAVATLCGAVGLAAQEGEPNQPAADQEATVHEVNRATSKIDLDGVLDEPAWEDATSIPILYEWFPGDNVAAPVDTVVLVTYDDSNFYVGFRAYDPRPEEIRAHLMDRDQIDTLVQDDYVIVQIDTFNDQRRNFQFRVNPLGVQAEALSSEVDRSEDWSWDMIWTSKGRITADGYEVEIALPFNQLRFPNTREAQTWGFDVGRSWPRSSRHRMNASGRNWDQSCWVCQFQKITGLEGLEPGRNLEFDPTITASRTDELDEFPDGDLKSGDTETEAGLTARWGITPNLTLSGTINPDFSQVEADVAQLNVNERFALFFPEKRPFFLEGIASFNTPNRLVFTRTVVDPDWGIKLAGKQGPNGLGIFAVEDSVNSLVFPSSQGSTSTLLDESVTSGVVRYRRDVGASSAVGLVYTGREGDDYHNRVVGLDAFLRPRDTDTLMLHYVRSETLYPDAVADEFGQPTGSFDDDFWEVRYQFSNRNWYYAVDFEDYGADFRADSGFVPRVGILKGQMHAFRSFWGGEEAWYDQWDVGAYVNHTEDHDGQLLDEIVQFFTTVRGPLQSISDLAVARSDEYFNGVLYEDLDYARLFVQVQPSGSLQLQLSAVRSDAIDYSNNQPADQLILDPGLEAKIGRHLNLVLNHTVQRLDVDGGELFEANLSQLRLVYNVSTRMFVRAILQRLDLTRNPDLYEFPVEPETETLFTQLLFSYKVNARTVLFLGYSDNQLGLQDVDLTRTDRTLFFKIGYAWIL
jgi:hypothetical protein